MPVICFFPVNSTIISVYRELFRALFGEHRGCLIDHRFAPDKNINDVI
jgi:hypothetical protein